MTVRDRKWPIGSRVVVRHLLDDAGVELPPRPATVVKHGRDSANIYTRVRYDDGSEQDLHRGYLHAS